MGLAANRILQPGIVTTDAFGNRLGTDRPSTTDLIVAAGLPLGTDWSAGAGVRWLQEYWEPYIKGTAWALNAGVTWRKPGGWPWVAGVKLDNVGTLMKFEPDYGKGPVRSSATMALALDGVELAGGRLSLAGEAVKCLTFLNQTNPTRIMIDGQPAYWESEWELTTEPENEVGEPNAPAYEHDLESESQPKAVLSSWFRHGVRAELHEAVYRLGAEYERAFTLPKVGELRLALRGGRRVMPVKDLRSWTWGMGLAWRGLSLDVSVENQERRDLRRFGGDPWDGTRRLSLGWAM